MLIEYIQSALRHAHYELMEDGRFFATIPECRGLWADGATLEESRDELRGALQCWMMLGMRHGDELPVIDDIDLNEHAYAEADQEA